MSDINSLLKSGVTLLDQNKPKEALEKFNLALKENPKSAEVLFQKANALKSLNDFQSALEAYNQSLKINPKSIEIIYNKANLLKKLNKIEEAILCYEQVLYYSPNHALAHNNRGLCLVHHKKYDEAVKAFSSAVASDPANFGAFYNMGNCFVYMRKFAEALECYEKSLKINPRNSDAFFNKGNAHDELLQYDKALDCYENAIKHNSKMLDAHFNKGLVLNKKADFKSAIASYENAIKLNPSYDDAFYRKGVCLEELKEFGEAVQTFSQAIKLKPENPGYISERATAYLELKEVLNGFNDLNFARKILEEEGKIKSFSKEVVLRSKRNVEKIGSIDVIDVLQLFAQKIEFLDGNRELKKDFLKKVKPEIEKKFGVNSNGNNNNFVNNFNKNNFEKFINGTNHENKSFNDDNGADKVALLADDNFENTEDKSKKTSSYDKAVLLNGKIVSENKLLKISEEEEAKAIKMKLNSNKKIQELALKNNKDEYKNNLNNKEENGKSSSNNNNNSNKAVLIQITQQQINQQNITKINNIINITSSNTNKEKVSANELKKIFDLLFSVNEKVKKHEQKISKLSKKIEQIEFDLETKLSNHRKMLQKQLDSLAQKNQISEETKKSLIEYFNGFNSCFNRFYLTSQMIIQEQFKLTENNCISICSFLVSLVPIVGKALAIVGSSIANYLRSLKIKNQARKFVGLAADCTDLSQKIGKCSLEICLSPKTQVLLAKLLNEDVEKMLSEDYCFVQKCAKSVEAKINFALFNPEERSCFDKYGEYDANRLIKRFLMDEFDLDVEYDMQFVQFILNDAGKEEKNEMVEERVHCGCRKSGVCVIF